MLTAYIGMGANLPSPAGPPSTTLAAALEQIRSLGRITGQSSLYSTAPIGMADQPRFVNAVISLETGLSPRTLLARLLSIEREYGRDRTIEVANGPRSLDLDILLMGDLCLGASDLEIPHPRLAQRAFVLVPLHEIAPHAIEPRRHSTIAELLEQLRARDEAQFLSVVPMPDSRWDSRRDLGVPSSGSPG
jgi:2-amino-4-hydroxy-6-hydroxymethyldihydropteridine diphosphokinase